MEIMEFQVEAGEIISTNNFEVTMETSSGHVNFSATSAKAEHFGNPRFEPSPGSSAKNKEKVNPQISPESSTPPSVSNCYVFKSRLQEYAQRAGLTTPVYETVKEGPSHEPIFRSTVTLNNVRYDSLTGFFNRKAAEQSAAEVALVELSKSVDMKFGITVPVNETGLCKNLLQEYAQKMNYAMPLYECFKEENQGKSSMYSCIVEIGGTKYIGASASTKKEAEIKAARTALLAIQSAPSANEESNSVYTVVPQKKKGSDPKISIEETAAALKPKKGRFKKHNKRKMRLKKHGSGQSKLTGASEVNVSGLDAMESVVGDVICSPQNTADGMTVAMEERDLTNLVNLEGGDSGVDRIKAKTSVFNAGVGDGIAENALALVPFNGLCKDGGSLTMEASVAGEAGPRDVTS